MQPLLFVISPPEPPPVDARHRGILEAIFLPQERFGSLDAAMEWFCGTQRVSGGGLYYVTDRGVLFGDQNTGAWSWLPPSAPILQGPGVVASLLRGDAEPSDPNHFVFDVPSLEKAWKYVRRSPKWFQAAKAAWSGLKDDVLFDRDVKAFISRSRLRMTLQERYAARGQGVVRMRNDPAPYEDVLEDFSLAKAYHIKDGELHGGDLDRAKIAAVSAANGVVYHQDSCAFFRADGSLDDDLIAGRAPLKGDAAYNLDRATLVSPGYHAVSEEEYEAYRASYLEGFAEAIRREHAKPHECRLLEEEEDTEA